METGSSPADMVVIARRVVSALDNGEDVEAAFWGACRSFFGDSDRYGDSSRMTGTVYNELCGMMKRPDGTVDKKAMESFFRQVAGSESPAPASPPADETDERFEEEPPAEQAPAEAVPPAKPEETAPAGFSLREYEEKTTRLCPGCRARVPLSFTVCPSCGEKQPRSFWSRLFGSSCVWLAVFSVLLVAGVFKEGQIKESGDHFTIKCRYPVTGNAFVDKTVKNLMSVTVADFKKAIGTGPLPGDVKGELDIVYSTSRFSEDVAGFRFESYSFTGGAHGMTNIITRSFSLHDSKEIVLDDVFRPGSKYLPIVSALTVDALKVKLGADSDLKWIREGAGPQKKNFTRFNLVPGAIVFYFEPYAVACYAAGPQEVSIPFSKLKDVLAPPFAPAVE